MADAAPLRHLERALLAAFLAAATSFLAAWTLRANGATPVIVDELVYLWQAERIAHGSLTAPVPRHPEFVGVPFIPTAGGRRFGQYPVGYSLALAPWVAAGVPWALNVALSAASLWLLFVFARRLDGPRVAWTAAALTAASPFFVAQASIYLSHALALALTLVLLVALERGERSARPAPWLALAGLATGYALNVSPFVAAPMGLVALDRWLLGGARRAGGARAAAAYIAPVVCGGLAFCAVNDRMTGDPFTPAYYLNTAFTSQRVGFGENVGEGGFTPSMAAANTGERLAFLSRMLFGWPVSSFLFAAPYLAAVLVSWARRSGARRAAERGEGAAADRIDPWNRTLFLLFASTVVAYAFWFFPATNESLGPRYYFATLPALALFTARGIAAAGDLLARAARGPAPAARAARALPYALVVALTVVGTAPYLATLARSPVSQWRRGTRDFLRDLDRRGIDRGTIFVESPGENTLAASLLYVSRFDDEGDLVFALDRGPAEDARFLEDRGGRPAYYVKPRMALSAWQLHDRPVWERQAGQPP